MFMDKRVKKLLLLIFAFGMIGMEKYCKVTRQILIPTKYIEIMTEKGPHLLTREYPEFFERLDYIYDHCLNLTHPIDYKQNLWITPFSLHFNDDLGWVDESVV